MTNTRTGPPEREEPGSTPGTGPLSKSVGTTHTDKVHATPQPRQCAADALRRRRRAAYRMVPLDCGCLTRDPWVCRCTAPPLSEPMVDAGRDAALHVLEHGDIPLLEIEVLRALWRRGGDDRRLAQQLHQLTGGRAA